MFGYGRVGIEIRCIGIARHANANGNGDGVQFHIVTSGRPSDDDLAQGVWPCFAHRGQEQFRDHTTLFIAVGVAECDLHATTNGCHWKFVEDADVDDTVGRLDFHRHVLCNDRGQTFELVIEDLGRLVGTCTPVVIARTVVGDERKKLFVVPVTETDCGGCDVATAGGTGDTDEFVVVTFAHIGMTIGEQDDAAKCVGTARSFEHLETFQPAATEVGHAATMNGVHSSDRFIGDVAIERKNKFDGIVESDDTDTVVRANESEEVCNRSLDRLDGGAVHGTGLVENKNDVERWSVGVGRWGSGELNEKVDNRVVQYGDDCAVEGDLGLHKAAPWELAIRVVRGERTKRHKMCTRAEILFTRRTRTRAHRSRDRHSSPVHG